MMEVVLIVFGCIFAGISLALFILLVVVFIDEGDFDIMLFLGTLASAIFAIITLYGCASDSGDKPTQYESQLYDCTKYTIDTISYNKDGSPKEFKVIEIK